MRPLGVLLCSVIVFCFCYCDPYVGFTVTQTPSNLTVEEGESVTITCCWSKNITAVKVKWYKDDQQTGVSGSDNHLQTGNNNNCSVLSINSTSKTDTGYYICEVIQDIPTLVAVNGTRTIIEIQAKNRFEEPTLEDVNSHKPPSTEEGKDPVSTHDGVIYFLRCLPFITLLLAVCYLNRDANRSPKPKPCSQSILNAEAEERELVEGGERETAEGNERVEEERKLEQRNETPSQDREEEEDRGSGQKPEPEERDEQTRPGREIEEEKNESKAVKEEKKGAEGEEQEKKGAEGEEQEVKMDGDSTE